MDTSFWDIIWWVFISFVFIAYLMLLFNIIGDLFRDSSVSGLMKGLWIIALIFVPFLTALIYLIARGNGMAERQMQTMADMQARQNEYIKQVAGSGSGSTTEEIASAKALLDSGAITQAEFEAIKAKALA